MPRTLAITCDPLPSLEIPNVWPLRSAIEWYTVSLPVITALRGRHVVSALDEPRSPPQGAFDVSTDQLIRCLTVGYTGNQGVREGFRQPLMYNPSTYLYRHRCLLREA